MKINRIAKILISAAFLSLPVASNAHLFEDGPKPKMREVFSQLDLTIGQKQELFVLKRNLKDEVGVYRADLANVKRDVGNLVKTDELDVAAVEAQLTAQTSLISQLGLAKAEHRNEVWNVLTDEQREKLADLMEDKGSNASEKREERKARFISKLELTEEQQASFEQINAAFAQQKEVFKEKRMSFRTAEKAIIQQETFDEEAWMALFNVYSDDAVAMGVEKAKHRHEIWNILTDEQREKLEKRMEKRGFNQI